MVLGAVAYDPKVVTIWDGFKAHFEAQGLPFDYVLFHNYERQVQALFDGYIDVAWHSPLAWVQQVESAAALGRSCRAVVMRDTDCDLRSAIVVRTDGPDRLRALRGGKVGVGAADSPQATLLPLLHLADEGIEPGRDVAVVRHDVLLGKHGDHVGGERDAARALLRGEVDAACMIEGNLLAFASDGTLPAGSVRVLSRTAPYDHCNFTVLDGKNTEAFEHILLAMRWDDPAVRRLMDLEGLREWRPGRTTGYAALTRAWERFR